jgi:hypothetical protein
VLRHAKVEWAVDDSVRQLVHRMRVVQKLVRGHAAAIVCNDKGGGLSCAYEAFVV